MIRRACAVIQALALLAIACLQVERVLLEQRRLALEEYRLMVEAHAIDQAGQLAWLVAGRD